MRVRAEPAPPGQERFQPGNPHSDRVDVGQAMVCALSPESEARSRGEQFRRRHARPHGHGTSKPIRDVKVGDLVLATDPESGRTEARAVAAVRVGESAGAMAWVVVHLPGKADGVLLATAGHPFWDAADREWVDAGRLAGEDRLRTFDGELLPVADVRPFQRVQTVYNLTVDGIHTYHVLAGDMPVLVHNNNVPGSSLTILVLSTTFLARELRS